MLKTEGENRGRFRTYKSSCVIAWLEKTKIMAIITKLINGSIKVFIVRYQAQK